MLGEFSLGLEIVRLGFGFCCDFGQPPALPGFAAITKLS
jgi:hypothetical protein